MAARKVVSRELDEYTDALGLIEWNIERLLAAARDHDLGVVYSCLGYEGDTVPSAFQEATGWQWRLDGPDGAFPPAWQPAPGERVFAKPGWGRAGEPDVPSFLTEQGVENLLVVGAMFDFGIRQTCYELMDRGLGSLVISDAVAPLTEAAQGHVTGNLAHGLVKFRSTAEVLDLFAVMRRDGMVLV